MPVGAVPSVAREDMRSAKLLSPIWMVSPMMATLPWPMSIPALYPYPLSALMVWFESWLLSVIPRWMPSLSLISMNGVSLPEFGLPPICTVS